MDNRPIGIFDSGVGGLTVEKQIFKRLPDESVIYLGDTARVPYGTKSPETIKKYSVENADFLIKHNVKLIIAACNTASSTSMEELIRHARVPVVGVIKPGARKAVEVTRNNKIGVIGTYTTIRSKAYVKEIKNISPNADIVSKPCPLFVPLVEEGWLREKATFAIAEKYLASLRNKGIDTLVLGCTHYPLLKQVIAKVMGKKVKIIDSASSVAEEVYTILMSMGELTAGGKKPRHKFFATDAVENFVRIGERFLGTKIQRAERASYV
jgi:glutamate racemase